MATKKQVPQKWDEVMKAQAAMYAEAEASVALGSFISFRAGVMKYHDSPIEGNKLDCIVLDAVLENSYYEGDYDPENPQPPVCYAFGRDGKVMKPHEQSEDKQHSECEGCPQNEFGSAEKGRGKACKNIRRLALIPVDGKLTPDVIAKTEIAFAKVPVTSVAGWAAYVRNIADVLRRPPFGVITTMSVQPDTKSQFKVTFKIKEEIDDAKLFDVLIAKHEEAKRTIEFPYPKAEESSGKKPAKKTAKRRKY